MVFFSAWGEREALEEHELFTGDFVSFDRNVMFAGLEGDLAEIDGHIHALLAHFAFERLISDQNGESAAEGLLALGGNGAAVSFDLGFVRFWGVVVDGDLETTRLGEAGFKAHGAVFGFPALRMRGDRCAFAEAPAFAVHRAEKLGGEDAEFIGCVGLEDLGYVAGWAVFTIQLDHAICGIWRGGGECDLKVGADALDGEVFL